MIRRLLKYCILLPLLHCLLIAQARRDRTSGAPQAAGEGELQAVNLVSPLTGMSRLDVAYRFPQSFFVFTRDNAPSAVHPFRAGGEIFIEIIDSGKISVGQRTIKKELAADAEPGQSPSPPSIAGAVSFDLPPGPYSIVMEISDNNSNRRYRDNSRAVRLKDFGRDDLQLSDLVFCDPESHGDQQLLPYNLGGDIPFSRNALCYAFISTSLPAESVNVAYTISQVLPEESAPVVLVRDTLPHAARTPARVLSIDQQDDRYRYVVSETPIPRAVACSFSLVTDTLPLGAYQLEVNVSSGTRSVSLTKKFLTRWLGMPMSLRQMKFAIEAMAYLLPPDTLQEFRSANPKKQRQLFNDYWKRRDPTPGTAFNEVMEEYYKRVDYAFGNFNTLQEPNGVKTERGKAYILYGPPTSIERRLLPSADPQEIWLYANLQKRLIFVDEHRNGNYKLIAAEPL